MKRIFLTAAGMLALLHSFAQQSQDTGYKPRKLKIDEINIVSSYYHQDGDHAAVTGGRGSQKLMDIANVFEVKLVKYDKKLRKNTINAELGIDYYTSASSDMVDFNANSSASHEDLRIYPAITWSRENEKKHTTIGAGISSSTESDYQSFGGNLSFAKKTKNRMGEFSARLQAYLDQVELIRPTEFRSDDRKNDGYAARNTFSVALSYSQIINTKLQVMLLADVVQQTGFLSMPFYRVYFKTLSEYTEVLPNNRFKLPLGIRGSYFLGDRFIIKAYYRFYTDSWSLTSHTVNIEVPVKVTPFVSISPFYRFYNQTAARYFAPFGAHSDADVFYTSNFDLSKFASNFYGAGIRIVPPKGIFGSSKFSMIELRYGHYHRNNQLNANIVSLNLKFK